MIDHVIFVIPLKDGGEWFNKPCVENLRRPAENIYSGNVGNLKIRQYLDSVVIMGSLAKFLHGENMTNLYKSGYIDEVRESLQKLQDATGISLENGIIKSVEVGASVIVKEKASDYLRLFGRLGNRYKKNLTMDNELESICYNTRAGYYEFKAYDKVKEMRDTGMESKIPEIFEGWNVLRLEYKIRKRKGIKDKFGRDLKPWDLCDRATYKELKTLFHDFYKSIPKMGRIVFMDRTKEYKKQELEKLQAEQYRQWFPDEYMELLAKVRFKDDERTRKRILSDSRDLQRNAEVSDRNPLILELDESVRLYAK